MFVVVVVVVAVIVVAFVAVAVVVIIDVTLLVLKDTACMSLLLFVGSDTRPCWSNKNENRSCRVAIQSRHFNVKMHLWLDIYGFSEFVFSHSVP